MGAIYGHLSLNDELVQDANFAPIAQDLSIWGPDALDSLELPSGRFIQTTLWISPQSQYERIVLTASGYVVCADAILDNRPELAIELDLRPERLSQLSDTQLIGMAWDKWHADCLQHLIGDFSFAIAHPAKKHVFLARDHIGSRPLYWARHGNSLIWSTSAKSLIDQYEGPWQIDEKAIVAFQVAYNDPLTDTFFDGLRRVKPGSQVEFIDGKSTQHQWWNPGKAPIISLASPDLYVQKCRAILERAVSDRCNSNQPIGAHLSGGIDSTAVAVLANRHFRKKNKKLCGGYAWSPPISTQHPDLGQSDERRRILATAEKEDIAVRFGGSEGENLFAFFQRPLETEGNADLADELPILINAADDGARVLLSGWGGDEAFSAHGYGYVGYLLLRLRFKRLAEFIRQRTRGLKNVRLVVSELWWNGIHPSLPNILYVLFDPFRDKDYGLCFMDKVRAEQNRKFISRLRRPLRLFPDPKKNILKFLKHGHLSMRMETWAAWSAPYKLQYRYPLTDRRLLEFLLSIPPEILFLNERSRGFSRAILQDVIPADVSKQDAANELYRREARFACWKIVSERLQKELLEEDCPWFDMEKLRMAASNPLDQSTSYGVARFGELMTALRLWFMWKRRRKAGIQNTNSDETLSGL